MTLIAIGPVIIEISRIKNRDLAVPVYTLVCNMASLATDIMTMYLD